MPLFPSREWIEEFCRRLAADPRTPQAATALDGVYRFVVEPGGPVEQEQRFDVSLRPGGETPDVDVLADGHGQDPRLTMSAGYPAWRQLISGQLDVMMAVLTGRVRVAGDVPGLMGQLSSAQPLVDALRDVDTEWPT